MVNTEQNEQERTEAFEKVSRQLSEVLDGHPMHTVIPALTSLLGQSAAMSGMPQSALTLYLLNCINKIYEEYALAISTDDEDDSSPSLH